MENVSLVLSLGIFTPFRIFDTHGLLRQQIELFAQFLVTASSVH
jgi:hypothetical protein